MALTLLIFTHKYTIMTQLQRSNMLNNIKLVLQNQLVNQLTNPDLAKEYQTLIDNLLDMYNLIHKAKSKQLEQLKYIDIPQTLRVEL